MANTRDGEDSCRYAPVLGNSREIWSVHSGTMNILTCRHTRKQTHNAWRALTVHAIWVRVSQKETNGKFQHIINISINTDAPGKKRHHASWYLQHLSASGLFTAWFHS